MDLKKRVDEFKRDLPKIIVMFAISYLMGRLLCGGGRRR
jgi:hypothetical protein